MFCEHCGDRMRPETTIKLRRSFGRVRASRFEGGYCTGCKRSAPQPTPAGAAPAGAAPAAPPIWQWLSLAQRSRAPGGLHA